MYSENDQDWMRYVATQSPVTFYEAGELCAFAHAYNIDKNKIVETSLKTGGNVEDIIRLLLREREERVTMPDKTRELRRWQYDQCANHCEDDEDGYCHRIDHPEMVIGNSFDCRLCPYGFPDKNGNYQTPLPHAGDPTPYDY